MVNGVVRLKVQILISVCFFTVHKDLNTAIWLSNDECIQERDGSVSFRFMCEFDVPRGVHLVFKCSVKCSISPLRTISNTSSTYLFHRRGLHSKAAVCMACFSRNSMYILAIMGETGLPMHRGTKSLLIYLYSEGEICAGKNKLQ